MSNTISIFARLLTIPILFWSLSQDVFAQQTVQTSLQRLIETGARGYIQPLAAGFTTNINGAWFHEAPPARKLGFMVELGAVAMFAGVPTDQTFRVASDYTLTTDQAASILARTNGYSSLPQSSQSDILRSVVARSLPVEISGPTVIGSKSDNVRIGITANQAQRTFSTTVSGRSVSVVLPASESISLDVRGLLDTKDYIFNSVPFAAPQLTIGTIMGTRGVIRYVPNVSNWVGLGSLGDIGMFGWGVQHNPLVWFAADTNALPFSIALNYYNQSYTLTNAIRATGAAYGISASWTFGGAVFAITPYAGFLLETSRLSIDYQYQPRTATGQIATDIDGRPITPVPIAFDVVGENTSRIVLGASARILYAVDIGAEVNIGNRFSTFNLNASVRFGNDLPR